MENSSSFLPFLSPLHIFSYFSGPFCPPALHGDSPHSVQKKGATCQVAERPGDPGLAAPAGGLPAVLTGPRAAREEYWISWWLFSLQPLLAWSGTMSYVGGEVSQVLPGECGANPWSCCDYLDKKLLAGRISPPLPRPSISNQEVMTSETAFPRDMLYTGAFLDPVSTISIIFGRRGSLCPP